MFEASSGGKALAQREGEQAREAGKLRNANPYTHPQLKAAWDLGWGIAHRRLQQSQPPKRRR